MLFYLESADGLEAMERGALSNVMSDLIRSHRLGHHLVVIDRAAAAWIRGNVDLSGADAAMLVRIAQNFAQTGDLRRRARVYVNLTTRPERNLTVSENSIFVSIDRLSDYRILDRAVLLIENLDADGDLYDHLFRNHCDLHFCNNVSFDRHHGGGADLPTVFGHLARDFKIVCAVVDSDRRSPLTAAEKESVLARVKQEANWPVCFFSTTPCHESENILPMSLVMELPSGIRNRTNGILLQIDAEERAHGERLEEKYWLFFDVKEGLTREKFEGMTQADRDWVATKLQYAGVDPLTENLTGYGDRVIRQVFAENRFQGDLRKLTRHGDWRHVFSAFLEDIVWALVASRKVVT